MSNTINEKLTELASEFAAIRNDGKKNWFPKSIWNRAFLLAQKMSVEDVCQAIRIKPAYFQKKCLYILLPIQTCR